MRLTCQMPNPLDATSLYRGLGPLGTLQKQEPSLQVDVPAQFTWASMKMADVLMLQRPGNADHVKVLGLAKAHSLPVWVDFDDDLFCLPQANPNWKYYSKPEVQNLISDIIARCDAISVSTEFLAERMRSILIRVRKGIALGGETRGMNLDARKVVVIPNAYDPDIMRPFPDGHSPSPSKLIYWRGSKTHDKDMEVYTGALRVAYSKHLDWALNFIGEPFWKTIEAIDTIEGINPQKFICTEVMPPTDYLDFLGLVSPAICVVPLEKVPFNAAKSNISWIEATHAGAVCLAPDWPEWQRPGVLNYKDPAEFAMILDRFCSGEIDGVAKWHESWEWIKSNLLLRQVNAKRVDIIQQLRSKGCFHA